MLRNYGTVFTQSLYSFCLILIQLLNNDRVSAQSWCNIAQLWCSCCAILMWLLRNYIIFAQSWCNCCAIIVLLRNYKSIVAQYGCNCCAIMIVFLRKAEKRFAQWYNLRIEQFGTIAQCKYWSCDCVIICAILTTAQSWFNCCAIAIHFSVQYHICH